jgi:hypothetical protein
VIFAPKQAQAKVCVPAKGKRAAELAASNVLKTEPEKSTGAVRLPTSGGPANPGEMKG